MEGLPPCHSVAELSPPHGQAAAPCPMLAATQPAMASELEGQDVGGRKVEALRQYLAHVVLGEAPGNGACIAPVVEHLPHLRI